MESEKIVLEVQYDIEKGGYSWDYPHRLNAFLLVGILEAVKEDLLREIRQATDDRYGDDDEC